MKVFIPFEDDLADQFFDQLCPDDRLVPWQTAWLDYIVINPDKDVAVSRDAGLVPHPPQAAIDAPGRH